MLNLFIEGVELFNEEDNTFTSAEDVQLQLEHSLVSLSKWESEHKKPFLSKEQKAPDEIRSYVKAMIITPNYPDDVVSRLDGSHMDQIVAYIESSESATTFGTMPEVRGRGEVITSELIYYWLVAFNIPFECQTWHLNRLFSLIRICNIKNAKPTKMSRQELMARNRALNDKRRAELGTRG